MILSSLVSWHLASTRGGGSLGREEDETLPSSFIRLVLVVIAKLETGVVLSKSVQFINSLAVTSGSEGILDTVAGRRLVEVVEEDFSGRGLRLLLSTV